MVVVPLLTGLIPMLVVTVCTFWSISIDAVPACMPFIDGCMSISAACRSVPVIYLFRSVMLPCCVLLLVFWWLDGKRLARVAAGHTFQRLGIVTLGMIGAVFLAVYVVFLGTDGEVYRFMRRLGVYLFFAGTAIAQLWTVMLTRASDEALASRLQRYVVLGLLSLGPLNLVLKAWLEEPDRMENIIEWHFGLLMFSWFVLSAWTNGARPPAFRAEPGT